MLRAMEPVTRPGMTIIDVGCGTGILSVAAHLLGAGREIACDIDPLFLHAIPSGLDGCVFVGSADAIRDHSADIVLANISAKVIDWIAYDLNRIARPNGIILISGFTRDMVPTRFSPLQELEDDDWLCWVCKPAFSGASPPPRLHTLQWY
jgi:ribosomal protein L11 methyltransferase